MEKREVGRNVMFVIFGGQTSKQKHFRGETPKQKHFQSFSFSEAQKPKSDIETCLSKEN